MNEWVNKLAKVACGIMVLFMVIFDSSCSSCVRRNYGSRGGGRPSGYHQSQGRENRSGGGCSRRGGRSSNNPPVNFHQPVYFSQNIEVHQGVSLQETLYLIDPLTREEEQKYDVGGTKLIAEMSADVAGVNYSRNEYNNIYLNILSLNELKLHVVNSTASMYNRIISNQVSVRSSRVGLLEGSNIIEIFENFLAAFESGAMVVHFKLVNNTNNTISCEILQGQMLEAVREGVQNLVVAETTRFTMRSYEEKEVDVHVYCAAHYRRDPSGSSVRFTRYFLNASTEVYNSQSAVWNYIESRY